jgi:hypothetical protein
VRVATFDVSPSESIAGVEASANGPRRVKNSFRLGAARCMSAKSGVCSSASSPRRAMVGRSSSRKVGSFWKVRRSSARRVAVISAVSPASSTQRTTSALFASSSSITRSESEMKSLMTWFWSPRICSTREVSRRPGWARRSASARSSGRPASPVPSVVMMRRKRSRYGRRMMLLMRSAGIVEVVCSTGTVPPSRSLSGELPGWQSTKYSPIRDWGLMSQVASVRKSSKPRSVTSMVTTALGATPSRLTTRMSPTVPAVTPPTWKSPPSTRPKALSNSTW